MIPLVYVRQKRDETQGKSEQVSERNAMMSENACLLFRSQLWGTNREEIRCLLAAPNSMSFCILVREGQVCRSQGEERTKARLELVIWCTQLQAHMSEQPLLIQVTDLRFRHSWLGSGEKSCVCTEWSIRGGNSPSTGQKSSKAGLMSSRRLCYRCGIS